MEQGKASCVAVGEGNEVSGKATLLPGDSVGAKALSVRKMAFATVKAEGKLVVLRLRGTWPVQEAEAGEPTRCLQRPALLILLRAIHGSPTSTGQPRTAHESFLTSIPFFFFHFDFFLPLSSRFFSSSCLCKTRGQNKMVKHGSACRGWRKGCVSAFDREEANR